MGVGQTLGVLPGSYLHDIGKLGVPDAFYSSRDLSPRMSGNYAAARPDGVRPREDIPFLLTQPKLFSRITNATTAAAIGGLKEKRFSERANLAVADTLDGHHIRQGPTGLPLRSTSTRDDRHLSGSQFDPKVVSVF